MSDYVPVARDAAILARWARLDGQCDFGVPKNIRIQPLMPVGALGLPMIQEFVVVFVAGLVTALGTGLGTVPLFWARDVSGRVDVLLWGIAGGLMVSASVFGLLFEAYQRHSGPLLVGAGLLAGVLLVVAAHEIVHRLDYEPADVAAADADVVVNIFFVLFVHSFPEGIAIGVSFVGLDLLGAPGVDVLGLHLPILAVVMTVAIAIHNVPEGVAVGVPLRRQPGISNWRMFWAAVATSLPQPVGAVLAYYFVVLAVQFLGFGYGFAAGAMIYLVIEDVIPEGLEAGEGVPNGRGWLSLGAAAGVVAMMPLVFFL